MVNGIMVTHDMLQQFAAEEHLTFGEDGSTRWIKTSVAPVQKIEAPVPWFLKKDGTLNQCTGDEPLKTKFESFIINCRREHH